MLTVPHLKIRVNKLNLKYVKQEDYMYFTTVL